MATWKEKYNKKYDYPKSESHSLSDISKDTGVSKKGLQQIYNKGIGAYKTNPQSVRPTVTSKEQWAMARVYSSVMGGKASKVDAKELKMQKGGVLLNPNFKKWFGDSKVVEENGNPLVVYHGTANDFKVFDKKKIGDNYSYSGYKSFFFAQKERTAKNYAELHSNDNLNGKNKGYVISSYLKIENPLYRETNSDFYRPADIFDMKGDDLVREAEYYGNDGIIIKGTNNDNLYIVFEPNQIKSATNNDGKYSLTNDNINMEMGGSTDDFDRTDYYKGYYERLSPSDFVVEKENEKITINMNDRYKSGGRIFPQAVTHDGIDEVDAIANGFFAKGGETDFNPDGKIKDKIVHASGEAGGMLVGKRHSNGGIKALNKSTGQPLEMEGGEVVITRDAVSDNKKRSFNGKMMTNRQILSAINESGGGVSFADGGQVPSDVQFDCNAEYEYGGKTMCGKDLAYALGGEITKAHRESLSERLWDERGYEPKYLSSLNSKELKSLYDTEFAYEIDYDDLEYATGGVTTAIVTDPNEAMADLQSTYGFGDVYAKGGEVNEAYVDFMNKDNGFKVERKYFKTYQDAEKWARSEFERFNPDMISYTEYETPLRSYDNGGTIECGSCDWSWDRKDGGDDMYVCHKCGTDNTSKYDDSKAFDKAREELGKEYLDNLDKFAEGGHLSTDEFPIDIDEATFVKDLGGSTGAKLYEYKGKRFVVKLGATSGQSYDEFLANQVYYILDVPVPRSTFIGGNVVKEFVGKEEDVDYDNSIQVKLILRGFVADALLGNWDIYKNDNIILKEGTRTPFRIDSGGSLRYRARGEEKDNFGTEVTELKTLIENNPKLKPYITDSVIKKGIEKIIKEKENILDLFKDDGSFRIKMEGRINYLEGVLNEINDRRGADFVDEEVEVKADIVESKEPSFEEKFLLDKISELRKRYEIKKRYLSEIQKGIALRDIRKYEIALDEIRLNNTSFETLLENFINSTTVEFGDINEKRDLRKGKSINGEKSELTKWEYDAVRSESFINWFGDWELANETGNYEGVSKIINSETKEPLVVYHGTDTKFISWETYTTNNLHYFAKKKRFADFFATSWQQRTDSAGVDSASIKADNPIKGTFVYSCFLDIKNPIDFTPFGIDKVPFNDYLKYLEVKYDLDLSKIEGYNDLKDRTEKVYSWVVIRKWQQFNLFVKNNTPYDGFSFYEFIPDSKRRGFEDASLSFTAFNSNQIKFTNNTSFSKFTDDSRLEIGGIIF